MTQRKKLSLVMSCVLILVLACAMILPFANRSVAIAEPPTVSDRESWVNPYDGSYYDNLNTDKRGTAFRSDLANLITTTHKHQTTYDELKTVYKTSDADPNKSGNVIWFYTGTSVPYTGAMISGDYPTNREHVWPKLGGKAFPEKSQAGSDAHHLRPLNDDLNTNRGNLQFGEVAQTTSNRVYQSGTARNYGTTDPNTWCYKSSTFFYPAKGYRGATARILFYVQTRWGDVSNLSFVLGNGATKTMGDIETLMKWHLQEPPTDQEIRRNEVVFGIQGNRNPFIDHPEYAEMIYCNDNQSYSNTLKNVVAKYGSYLNNNVPPIPDDDPTSLTLSVSSLQLKVGESSQQITVTAVPQSANNSVVWSTTDERVATVANGVVRAVGTGTATITATSTAVSSVKASLTVTVSAPSVTSLTITPNPLTLTQGGTRQLSVTAYPAGADNSVSWSSGNDNVATVSPTGLVTAVGEGTAVITATSNENGNIKATVTVTVTSTSQPPVVEDVQPFIDSVTAIESTQTLEERYDALNKAINLYNALSNEGKQRVTQQYNALVEAVQAYNSQVAPYNDDLHEATEFASQATALTISAVLLALFAIVTKKLGR